MTGGFSAAILAVGILELVEIVQHLVPVDVVVAAKLTPVVVYVGNWLALHSTVEVCGQGLRSEVSSVLLVVGLLKPVLPQSVVHVAVLDHALMGQGKAVV